MVRFLDFVYREFISDVDASGLGIMKSLFLPTLLIFVLKILFFGKMAILLCDGLIEFNFRALHVYLCVLCVVSFISGIYLFGHKFS